MTGDNSPQMTLIMGVGNIIMGDEGFGVHVVRKLRKIELPDNVRIEEGGVGGFNLLGSLEGIDRVIVVDVMMTGTKPGEVCLFKPGSGFGEPGKNLVSFHQVGILELVKMWRLLGYETQIFFLVAQPQKIEWAAELTPALATAANKAVALVRELCCNNFAGLERSTSLCTS